jgi:hypothetical protein
LMVLIPIFGSSGKKMNIWSEKQKSLLLIQPYLLPFIKVAYLLNCCVHLSVCTQVPVQGLLNRLSPNFILKIQKTGPSNSVFITIKKNTNYMQWSTCISASIYHVTQHTFCHPKSQDSDQH